MDRPLVLAGTVFVAVLVGYGIASTASARTAGSQGLRSLAGARASPVRGPQDDRDLLAWDGLAAYAYEPGLRNLPESLKALDGKTVTMRGFLAALYEYDDIHEFVLVRNPASCCFGPPATFTEQVLVRLSTKDGLPHTSERVEVTGVMRVHEVSEQDYVVWIYEIQGGRARILGH